MIDAYDTLGLPLTATEEEIKKAYKRLSLQCHPDKVMGGDARDTAAAAARFNDITSAKDILSDGERRKIYDTFGLDLGEERPEMEVWTIGMGTLLSPLGGFVLKTIVARFVIWLVSFSWIGWLLILLGVAAGVLYYADAHYGEMRIRSQESVSILMNVAVLDVVILLHWLWPLLADTVCVLYLASEVAGLAFFVESWKIGVAAGLVSMFLAWLVRGWWLWIIGFEFLLAVILLVALTISSGIMRLWIDSVQVQHGDKLKQQREGLRATRKLMETEILDLKRKLEVQQDAAPKRASR
ncbi:unnamed protein product [Polarella glacialis]|uniref:J domain-containing protein n=1 Tax=Polarella glacialis TaxID=89957 RepID=A0A813KK87_POLGL|nr:unnamed protein product [Polarella glacialis]CAE8702363.1 unnamed protein product [Polarella glacialis]